MNGFKSNIFGMHKRTGPMAVDLRVERKDEVKRDIKGLIIAISIFSSMIFGFAVTSKKTHAGYIAPVSVCSLVDARGEE